LTSHSEVHKDGVDYAEIADLWLDEKMDEDIKEKVEGYLWLLEQIKQKVEDSLDSRYWILDSRRVSRIENRASNRCDDLGISYPKNVKSA